MKRWIIALSAMLMGAKAWANEPQIDLLFDWNIFERIEKFGSWSHIHKGNVLTLICEDCKDERRVFIVVQDHRASLPDKGFAQGYLAERRQHCQHLVSSGTGRCLGTDPITARWLGGFRSKSIEDGQHHTETLLFYGGHVLTAIVREGDGFNLGDEMGDFLTQALVRMTPAW